MKPLAYLLLFFGLLAVILPSCLPQPSDPYTLRAQGENALNVAHAQMTATAEAAILEERAAILQQAQTQASNDNAATATSQRMSGLQTATSQAVQSTQTAVALQKLQSGATATQAALETRQVVEATATQHAADLAALELSREQAQLQREKLTRWILWGLFALLLALLVFAGAYAARKFIEAYERQKRWVPGAETFYLDTSKGPVLVPPRKMLGPALSVENQTQTVAMPLLADPAMQLQTTLAALAVELQREASKQLFYHQAAKRAQSGVPKDPGIPQILPASGPVLPLLPDRHILIAGPTGSGKTYTARYLLQARPTAYVLDPHHKPGEWPTHCQVIGGGRDFQQIAKTIAEITALMDSRYKARERGGAGFTPITLVTDEVPALAANLKEVLTNLMQIAREGRKVEIYLFLISQSVLVRELGIEGHGEMRQNFATIKLPALPPGVSPDTPRQVHLIVGDLKHPEQDEICLVPPLESGVPALPARVPAGVSRVPELPVIHTGTLGNRPEPGSQAEITLIRALRTQGFVPKRIAALLGGRTAVTLQRVKSALGEV